MNLPAAPPGTVWTETCRDDSVAPLRPIAMRGATWGIRERGDTGGQVLHVYRCPVHGEIEALVSRADVPDTSPCACGASAPWAGSRCGIGKAPGEVTG